eukprot:g25785.t1
MLLKQSQTECSQPQCQENSLFRWQGLRPRWALPVVGPCQEPHSDRAPRVEYLQSLRCHPSAPQMLSALVAASEPSPEAYVAAVHLEERGLPDA